MLRSFKAASNFDNKISINFIEHILDIYSEEYRFLKFAELEGDEFVGLFCVDKYPYAPGNTFDYVTAPSISLVIGQACYVYMGKVINNKQKFNYHDQLDGIDLAKYLSLRDKGNLLFTKNHYKFTKKIPQNTDFELHIKIRTMKRMKSIIAAKFEFYSENYFSGETSLITDINSV